MLVPRVRDGAQPDEDVLARDGPMSGWMPPAHAVELDDGSPP
jgi:hypothetical protein